LPPAFFPLIPQGTCVPDALEGIEDSNDLLGSDKEHEFVIRITNGIMWLRRNSRLKPALERDKIIMIVLDHLRWKCHQTPPPPEEDQNRKWKANYSTDWWIWAETGKDMPSIPTTKS
jgi:hypothetical protein